METIAITVDQIDIQIKAARERLASLRSEAHELSLPAVSGNGDAISSLAKTNAETDRVLADLVVLDQARGVALQRLASEDAAAMADYRARHLTIAQDRAAEIVKLAKRADELIAEFKVVFEEMSAIERGIWKSLRDASAPPSDAVVGRKSLASFAITALNAVANGTNRFGQTRAVADIAAKAWAHLLSNDDI
jgi:hypothetical protein